MKILLADRVPDDYVAEMEKLGLEVDNRPSLLAEEIPGAVGDARFLVVRSTRVTRETLESGKSLEMVIRAGAGTDTIDKAAATELRKYVVNCPGKNSVAVAELTMGLLLAIDRRIPDNVIDLRQGRWNKKLYAKADGLMGKTMGIVGMGRIGYEVMLRAKAFGLKVVGYDPYVLTPQLGQEWGIEVCTDLPDLASRVDIISVHVAKTPETTHMISSEFVGRMRPGAILLQMARGGVVDQEALKIGIREKGLRVGLDVYENEPAATAKDFGDDIVDLPGVYGTHHIGASTNQAQLAVASEVVRILDAYIGDGTVLNWVNRW